MTVLHDMVAAQVARTPDAVAVTGADGTDWTYRELERRANRIARRLRALGVVADTPVAVCLNRSAEMVAALYGVLKAGGAYLPVDPDTPAARVRVMAERSDVPVCVGERALADRLPEDLCRTLLLDRDREEIDAEDPGPVDAGVRPEHLVSVYYTSGSTGTPKGVASTHGGWVNRMEWMQMEHGLLAGETVLHKTTLSFDDSAVELFWPLSVGGRVAVLAPGEHKDPVALLEAARDTGAAVVQFVPSMLSLFLEAHRRAGLPPLPKLRHVVSSGEALTAPLALAFQEQIGVYGCRLHNQWGATEVSIDSTLHTCDPCDPHAGPVVSIGTPFTGNTVHVLDEEGVPVLDGETGELYIGGIGLARGYHRQPALTAARFLPDPFGPPGSRLYRTGDLGRRRPDGALEFLGRTDHQVKIRGVRIELGELEAALETHPRVRQAVATVRGELLLAFVTTTGTGTGGGAGAGAGAGEGARAGEGAGAGAAGEGEPLPAVLREHLAERLPTSLIPAHIVPLDEIPLNANGKVDRQQLPEVPASAGEPRGGRLPATAVQKELAAIWADVLNAGQVLLDDNFFELGGNSLLATQVMFRVQDGLGIEFPLFPLFAAETLEELAEDVEKRRASQRPPLAVIPRDGRLPLSFGQERLWFLHRLAPSSTAYHTPTACRLHGLLDTDAFSRAFDRLVARHEILRTRYVESAEGVPEARIDRAGPRLRTGAAHGEDRAARERVALELLESDWTTPFDLSRQVPLRARLTRLESYEHIFSLVIHHIGYDAHSEQILWRELSALYEAELTASRGPVLPDQPAQYVDHAAWQHGQAAGGPEPAGADGYRQEEQLDYWRSRLAGLTTLRLPTDRPRTRKQTFAGGRVPFTLEEEPARELRRLGREAGTTLFAALLAGFQATLARAAGQDDVAVGSPVPGRTLPEAEHMIGFFSNTLVMRTDCGGDPSFTVLLDRVRDVVHGAYANQDVPLEQVVRTLRPRREPGRMPFFDVIFNGVPASALTGAEGTRFAQLTASPIDLAATTTVADLVCSVAETPDLIRGELMYNTDLFDATTAERLVDRWLRLLRAAARDPHTPLSALAAAPVS